MFEDIETIFESYGISTANIKNGIIIFVLIHQVWVLILWIICYFFHPINYILSKIPIKYLQDKISNAKNNSSNNRLFRFLPERLKGKIFLAWCEALAIKTILEPLAFPIKLWITLLIIAD